MKNVISEHIVNFYQALFNKGVSISSSDFSVLESINCVVFSHLMIIFSISLFQMWRKSNTLNATCPNDFPGLFFFSVLLLKQFSPSFNMFDSS